VLGSKRGVYRRSTYIFLTRAYLACCCHISCLPVLVLGGRARLSPQHIYIPNKGVFSVLLSYFLSPSVGVGRTGSFIAAAQIFLTRAYLACCCHISCFPVLVLGGRARLSPQHIYYIPNKGVFSVLLSYFLFSSAGVGRTDSFIAAAQIFLTRAY